MVEQGLIPVERIERAILILRGQKVMIDADLAAMYGVETKTLVRAVKRNSARFPDDFAFQLSFQEFAVLKYQFGTSRLEVAENTGNLKSQSVTSRSNHGGRRKLPYAFTEQGVAMLSSVLRSPRAVLVNVEIMRAFVKLRQLLSSNAELAKRLEALEKKYDSQFKIVFDAIRRLMAPTIPTVPPEKDRRPIGFKAN